MGLVQSYQPLTKARPFERYLKTTQSKAYRSSLRQLASGSREPRALVLQGWLTLARGISIGPSLGLCELPVTFVSLRDACTLVRFVPVPDDVEQVTEYLGHIGDVAVA